SQEPVEIERAAKIAHANADVIDALDRNHLIHGNLLGAAALAQTARLYLMRRPAGRSAAYRRARLSPPSRLLSRSPPGEVVYAATMEVRKRVVTRPSSTLW